MKKQFILVGLLAVGFASAQSKDPYEGRIGINTMTPSATMNIKSLTGTDATTKNFELENANGDKLVTVLDDGRTGIGVAPNRIAKLFVNGELVGVNNRPDSQYSHYWTPLYSGISNNGAAVSLARSGRDNMAFFEHLSKTGITDHNLLEYTKADDLLGVFKAYDYKSVWESEDLPLGGAGMYFYNDGEITPTSKPSRISFLTTKEGEIIPVERVRISNGGDVSVMNLKGAEDRVVLASTEGTLKTGTIKGKDIDPMGATEGQFLRWNGTAWVPYSTEKKAYTYIGGMPRQDWMKVVCLGPENLGLTVLFDEGKAVCEREGRAYGWMVSGSLANPGMSTNVVRNGIEFRNVEPNAYNPYFIYQSDFRCNNPEFEENELLPKLVFSIMEGSATFEDFSSSNFGSMAYPPIAQIEPSSEPFYTRYNGYWTKLGCTGIYVPGHRPTIIFPPQMVK